MIIDDIEVTYAGFAPFEGELAQYVAYAKERKPNLTRLHCRQEENGDIALDYVANNSKFERIRRITGYLSGDLTTWNNSKRAEERDRVKHDPRI